MFNSDQVCENTSEFKSTTSTILKKSKTVNKIFSLNKLKRSKSMIVNSFDSNISRSFIKKEKEKNLLECEKHDMKKINNQDFEINFNQIQHQGVVDSAMKRIIFHQNSLLQFIIHANNIFGDLYKEAQAINNQAFLLDNRIKSVYQKIKKSDHNDRNLINIPDINVILQQQQNENHKLFTNIHEADSFLFSSLTRSTNTSLQYTETTVNNDKNIARFQKYKCDVENGIFCDPCEIFKLDSPNTGDIMDLLQSSMFLSSVESINQTGCLHLLSPTIGSAKKRNATSFSLAAAAPPRAGLLSRKSVPRSTTTTSPRERPCSAEPLERLHTSSATNCADIVPRALHRSQPSVRVAIDVSGQQFDRYQLFRRELQANRKQRADLDGGHKIQRDLAAVEQPQTICSELASNVAVGHVDDVFQNYARLAWKTSPAVKQQQQQPSRSYSHDFEDQKHLSARINTSSQRHERSSLVSTSGFVWFDKQSTVVASSSTPIKRSNSLPSARGFMLSCVTPASDELTTSTTMSDGVTAPAQFRRSHSFAKRARNFFRSKSASKENGLEDAADDNSVNHCRRQRSPSPLTTKYLTINDNLVDCDAKLDHVLMDEAQQGGVIRRKSRCREKKSSPMASSVSKLVDQFKLRSRSLSNGSTTFNSKSTSKFGGSSPASQSITSLVNADRRRQTKSSNDKDLEPILRRFDGPILKTYTPLSVLNDRTEECKIMAAVERRTAGIPDFLANIEGMKQLQVDRQEMPWCADRTLAVPVHTVKVWMKNAVKRRRVIDRYSADATPSMHATPSLSRPLSAPTSENLSASSRVRSQTAFDRTSTKSRLSISEKRRSVQDIGAQVRQAYSSSNNLMATLGLSQSTAEHLNRLSHQFNQAVTLRRSYKSKNKEERRSSSGNWSASSASVQRQSITEAGRNSPSHCSISSQAQPKQRHVLPPVAAHNQYIQYLQQKGHQQQQQQHKSNHSSQKTPVHQQQPPVEKMRMSHSLSKDSALELNIGLASDHDRSDYTDSQRGSLASSSGAGSSSHAQYPEILVAVAAVKEDGSAASVTSLYSVPGHSIPTNYEKQLAASSEVSQRLAPQPPPRITSLSTEKCASSGNRRNSQTLSYASSSSSSCSLNKAPYADAIKSQGSLLVVMEDKNNDDEATTPCDSVASSQNSTLRVSTSENCITRITSPSLQNFSALYDMLPYRSGTLPKSVSNLLRKRDSLPDNNTTNRGESGAANNNNCASSISVRNQVAPPPPSVLIISSISANHPNGILKTPTGIGGNESPLEKDSSSWLGSVGGLAGGVGGAGGFTPKTLNFANKASVSLFDATTPTNNVMPVMEEEVNSNRSSSDPNSPQSVLQPRLTDFECWINEQANVDWTINDALDCPPPLPPKDYKNRLSASLRSSSSLSTSSLSSTSSSTSSRHSINADSIFDKKELLLLDDGGQVTEACPFMRLSEDTLLAKTSSFSPIVSIRMQDSLPERQDSPALKSYQRIYSLRYAATNSCTTSSTDYTDNETTSTSPDTENGDLSVRMKSNEEAVHSVLNSIKSFAAASSSAAVLGTSYEA